MATREPALRFPITVAPHPQQTDGLPLCLWNPERFEVQSVGRTGVAQLKSPSPVNVRGLYLVSDT